MPQPQLDHIRSTKKKVVQRVSYLPDRVLELLGPLVHRVTSSARVMSSARMGLPPAARACARVRVHVHVHVRVRVRVHVHVRVRVRVRVRLELTRRRHIGDFETRERMRKRGVEVGDVPPGLISGAARRGLVLAHNAGVEPEVQLLGLLLSVLGDGWGCLQDGIQDLQRIIPPPVADENVRLANERHSSRIHPVVKQINKRTFPVSRFVCTNLLAHSSGAHPIVPRVGCSG